MKAIYFTLTAPLAVSAVQTTLQDCMLEQGAVLTRNCRSIWYDKCDEISLLPGETCNIETQSEASVEWFSYSIEVFYWESYMNSVDDSLSDDDGDGPDSSAWGLLRADNSKEMQCAPTSLNYNTYRSGTQLLLRSGMCGLKFQIVNNSDNQAYDITFLRNGASDFFRVTGAMAALASLAWL